MKVENLLEEAELTLEQCMILLNKKSSDYAQDDDALSNFKIVSEIVGITPQQVVMVFLATKIVRLGELSKGKTPNNESIEDSLLDNINYSIIFKALMR